MDLYELRLNQPHPGTRDGDPGHGRVCQLPHPPRARAGRAPGAVAGTASRDESSMSDRARAQVTTPEARPGDLVGMLTSLGAGDILFIDEVHRLRPVLEEFLYPAMEDYRVDVRIADGPHAQTIPMALERFTLIGATTRFGLLTPPMRARFGLVERLAYYPPDDLAQIISRSAGILDVPTDAAGITEIARRSRGTPRVANRLLKRVRDYAQVRAGGKMTAPVAAQALKRLGVDEFGLDDMDGRILKTIIEQFEGGPVGLTTIAAAGGEDPGTLEEVYEPFLMQQGFLARTPRGRCATAGAYKHFGFMPPRSAEQPTMFDG